MGFTTMCQKANKQIYWYMYTLANRKGFKSLDGIKTEKRNGVI